MDSLFEEGKIRVPLAAIRPAEQQCDQTHDLTAVLRDPTHLLACSISSHGRDALLRWLHCDSEHLRKAETPPLVQNQRVTCTYARHSLDQAKAELGENYTCNVHLYCVPPETEDEVMSDADFTGDDQSDVSDVNMEDNLGKARGGKRALQKHRRARTGPVHRAQARGKQRKAGSTTTGFGVRKLGGKGDSSNARKLRNQLEGGRVPVTEKSVAPVTSSGFEIPDMHTTMAPVQIEKLAASFTNQRRPAIYGCSRPEERYSEQPHPAIPDLASWDFEIPETRSSLTPIHMDSTIQQRQLIPGQSTPAVTPELPCVNSVTTVPPRVDSLQAAEDDNTTETHRPPQSGPVLAPGHIPDFVAQNRENNREFAGTREPDDFLFQQDFASDSPITLDVEMDSESGDLGVDIPDVNSGDHTSPPNYA
ncbi:hypothetical protein MY1884_001706 [Beauveria asiatica]